MPYKDIGKRRESRVNWGKTPNGKASKKKYAQSPKGKEAAKRGHKKYYNSTKGKAAWKRAGKNYRNSPKGKLSRQNECLKRYYGIDLTEYNKMFEIQHGVCAICSKPSQTNKNLYIDHDHSCCPGSKSCGKCIRELLCQKCNSILGFGNDSIPIFQSVIHYLEKHRRIK